MTVTRPAVGRVPVWFTLASIGPVLRCVALVGVGWADGVALKLAASGGMLWAFASDFLDTYFYESCPLCGPCRCARQTTSNKALTRAGLLSCKGSDFKSDWVRLCWPVVVELIGCLIGGG